MTPTEQSARVEAAHDHCWHQTNTWLTVNPPLAVDRCCLCGVERHLAVRIPIESPEGHGPYHPSRQP